MTSEALYIDAAGDIKVIGDPPIELVGEITRRRVATIVPCGRLRQPLFMALRWVFGHQGRVAAWTRTWRCFWYGYIHETREWKVSSHRSEIVNWERERLEQLLEKQ